MRVGSSAVEHSVYTRAVGGSKPSRRTRSPSVPRPCVLPAARRPETTVRRETGLRCSPSLPRVGYLGPTRRLQGVLLLVQSPPAASHTAATVVHGPQHNVGHEQHHSALPTRDGHHPGTRTA